MTQQLLPIARTAATARWLLREVLLRWRHSLLTLVVSTLAAAAAIVPIWVLGILVDRVRDGAPASGIGGLVAVMVAAALAAGVLSGIGYRLIASLGETVLADLREGFVDRALRLPLHQVEAAGRGDLLARAGDDVAVISRAVSNVIPTLMTAMLTTVLSIAAMVGLDWRLGLAGLAALPMYVLALRFYLPRSGPLYAEERVAMGERTQALVSSIDAAKTIRAYRYEEPRLALIDTASARARDIGITVFRLVTRFAARGNRAEFVGLASVLAVGFALVSNDTVTVGQTTAAALLFHRLFNPIGILLWTFDDIQSAGASLARLVGVVQIPAIGTRSRKITPPEPTDASLELRSIEHTYDGESFVLRGVNLHISPGERVAIVGATGAGKSTLAAIATGTLAPTCGDIRVGGVVLSDLGGQLRGHIAIVTQDVHVFAGSLADDVQLAAPEASDSEIRAALSAVGALAWADALPDGLGTRVGEGGHPLTAAQAQQLALARVLLADPAIVVLDEATAEAGSAGARDLEQSALAVTAGRTSLVIAHRLTQAMTADRVVVLEHGMITDEGPHAELVARGGHYSALWHAWSGQATGTPQHRPQVSR
ncbi:ABC transporter ATP-binding protein [Hoyosella subflava]|uniref:Putative ABC transporter permease/ATP-binding protein n=1 Tax=Hoyosella subflava (strain DSM 45089 / JCM 17490 / NBRC 109087 / DQS3-9A1) TaxID=443218 RepID=F6EPS1_HOYSD|nr:ABC transporter ATP-binding protein [Hoyosella subflava]AEF40550.1 Putative ABC transporter permease/ATP-binding protein [Hoyosella subflava DQS3-9A1]